MGQDSARGGECDEEGRGVLSGAPERNLGKMDRTDSELNCVFEELGGCCFNHPNLLAEYAALLKIVFVGKGINL